MTGRAYKRAMTVLDWLWVWWRDSSQQVSGWPWDRHEESRPSWPRCRRRRDTLTPRRAAASAFHRGPWRRQSTLPPRRRPHATAGYADPGTQWKLRRAMSIPSTCSANTHTRLTALCPGLPRWAGIRKVKPIWILLKQEAVSGSGISWAICKSAPRSRQITTPAPHHSVFYRPDALPATQSTASKHWRQKTIYIHKALKSKMESRANYALEPIRGMKVQRRYHTWKISGLESKQKSVSRITEMCTRNHPQIIQLSRIWTLRRYQFMTEIRR